MKRRSKFKTSDRTKLMVLAVTSPSEIRNSERELAVPTSVSRNREYPEIRVSASSLRGEAERDKATSSPMPTPGEPEILDCQYSSLGDEAGRGKPTSTPMPISGEPKIRDGQHSLLRDEGERDKLTSFPTPMSDEPEIRDGQHSSLFDEAVRDKSTSSPTIMSDELDIQDCQHSSLYDEAERDKPTSSPTPMSEEPDIQDCQRSSLLDDAEGDKATSSPTIMSGEPDIQDCQHSSLRSEADQDKPTSSLTPMSGEPDIQNCQHSPLHDEGERDKPTFSPMPMSEEQEIQDCQRSYLLDDAERDKSTSSPTIMSGEPHIRDCQNSSLRSKADQDKPTSSLTPMSGEPDIQNCQHSPLHDEGERDKPTSSPMPMSEEQEIQDCQRSYLLDDAERDKSTSSPTIMSGEPHIRDCQNSSLRSEADQDKPTSSLTPMSGEPDIQNCPHSRLREERERDKPTSSPSPMSEEPEIRDGQHSHLRDETEQDKSSSPTMMSGEPNIQDCHYSSLRAKAKIRICDNRDESSPEEDMYLTDDSVTDPPWKVNYAQSSSSAESSSSDEQTGNAGSCLGKINNANSGQSEDVTIHNITSEIATTSSSNHQPKKKIKTKRWHQRNEGSYKRNSEKALKSQCLPYKDYKGRTKPPKAPKPIDCKNCKFHCSEKINEDQRKSICKTYWSFGDYARQKDFILMNVKSVAPKRHLENSTKKRNCVKTYFFELGGEKIRVCQKFFEKTLSISNGPINKAFQNLGEHGNFEGIDHRGKHPAHNKTSQPDVNFVKEHIEQFPTMESHYCRKTSSKLYLDSKLSILKMYNLYIEQCRDNNRKPVSLFVYRRIFCTEYNLSFHKPKKDQCLTCHKYKQAAETQPTNIAAIEEKYNHHIELKNKSYVAKDLDKKRANEDPAFASITIDLQQVLHIPSGDVSLLYFLRKLNVYNASIYEARLPNNAYCIMWSEINDKKGSNEIGTALYKWIKTLPDTVLEVSIFSDTCSGQNRNQYLTSLMLYLVQTTHLKAIEQKYLESGHSYMEVDSIHSSIEAQQKCLPIYSMIDWINVVKLARSNRKIHDKKKSNAKNPYEVIELKYSDILDLKDLSSEIISNRSVDNEGQKVQWLKIKCIRYEKQNPNIVLFRYDYEGEYKTLKVNLSEEEQSSSKKSMNYEKPNLRRRLQVQEELSHKEFDYQTFEIKKAYKKPLRITKGKKNDLLKMCTNNIIPSELHPWYYSLPDTVGKDFLPESDVDDDNSDGEELEESTTI